MDEHLPDIYHNVDSMDYYKNGFEDGYFEETIHDVWENCVLESLKSIYNSVYKAVLCNLLFGIISTFGLPEILFHWLSALCGVFVLLATIQSTVGLTLVFASFSLGYVVILFIKLHGQHRNKTQENSLNPDKTASSFSTASVSQYAFIATFVLFEYMVLEKETWLEIRGVMMVFSMKFISIVTDLPPLDLPSLPGYCGYMFCSGNVLFGPWISFHHYLLQVNYPTKKNFHWIYGIVKALLLSFTFLTISNCWASYVIGDNSNSLMEGYKEALSFRSSHYFICYLSEAFILAAGWKNMNHHFDDENWSFSITSFLKIELPTSLAVVVVNWNKPMHEFLKKYIYRKWLPLGKFQAVLITFLISSLFHGFELKVSTVLISLGIFSYLQILVREHISKAFDICVKVHPCKTCQHKLKRDGIVCKMTLLVFSVFTVLHLVYLGVLMDQSTDEVGIFQKWNDLYFYSLWIMLFNFLVVK